MREQLIDPVIRVRGQSLQPVLVTGPRIVPIELGRLHQAHHHGGPLAGQLTVA